MTLQSYLRIFRERWRFIALVLLFCVGASTLITASTSKTYEASAQVFVSANGASGISGQYDQQAATQAQVTTFAQLITSLDIVHRVQKDLNLGLSDNALADKLSATAPPQQTLVIIHATDRSAPISAAIANSAARAFITVIEDLKRPTDSSKSTVRLFVTKQATAPPGPISPKPTLNIALGFILGLLLGIALAVARDVLDTRVKTADDLGSAAGSPTMGVVIDDSKAERYPIATRAGPRNVRAENFRQLRANLQFANVDTHPRVIAITSSVPSEGKTMVAINLASTLAETGFSVCLVDADLRRPTVAKVLGLAGPVGLTSVLIHQVDVGDALQEAGRNFYVLTSGPTPPNPSEVLASSYVRDVIRSILERVDYVIIDTAPLLPVADGSEVAALADGTLLVARHKSTTTAQVKRAITGLQRVDARLLGVVLNRVPNRRTGEYGYSYYRAEPTAPAHSEPDEEERSLLRRNGHRNGSAPSPHRVTAKPGRGERQ